MKTRSLLAAVATAVLASCAATAPQLTEAPVPASPGPSVNQPSMVESTAAEYEGPSSSTGSSRR